MIEKIREKIEKNQMKLSGCEHHFFEKIREEIERNQMKLNGCEHHFFEKKRDISRSFGYIAICRNCGGEVPIEAANMYDQGFSHGGEFQRRRGMK